jgi:hypothetical protein
MQMDLSQKIMRFPLPFCDKICIREVTDMMGMENDEFEEETEKNGSGDGEIEQTERPWDAKLIRVAQKVYSIRQIMDMIDDGSLDLNPDFQCLQVWEPKQKSRLIESIFLRIPIPTFYEN